MTRDVNIFPYFIYVFKSMSLVLKMIDLYDLLPLITVHNKYNKFLYGQVLWNTLYIESNTQVRTVHELKTLLTRILLTSFRLDPFTVCNLYSLA